MKKIYEWIMVAILLCGSFALSACVDNSDNPATEPMLTGKITSYNKYGAAMLDITEKDILRTTSTLSGLNKNFAVMMKERYEDMVFCNSAISLF